MTNFRTLAVATALLGTLALPAFAQGTAASAAAPVPAKLHHVSTAPETSKPAIAKTQSIKIDTAKQAAKPVATAKPAATAKPVVTTETAKPAIAKTN